MWTATIDGEKLEHSYSPVVEKQFVERTAKGGVLPGKTIIGVDPNTGKCTWWSFFEDGGVGTAVLTKESDGVWILESLVTGPEGKSEYKGRLTRVNADKVTEQVIKFILAGEMQPTKTYTWNRTR